METQSGINTRTMLLSLMLVVCFFQMIKGSTYVYVSGGNSYGELGLANSANENIFVINPNLNGTIRLAGGTYYALTLFEDGTVKAFGHNTEGYLGLGDYNKRVSPTLIPGFTNVERIYAGSVVSMMILTNGSVYTFGSNINGKLGAGVLIPNSPSPVLNPYLNGTEIKKVSLTYFALVLLNNGSVLGFGYNANGELGMGNFDASYYSPALNQYLSNVIDIANGAQHSLFLLSNGSVVVCGGNTLGQLGLGESFGNTTIPTIIPNLNNVVKIYCGDSFSYALLSNGSILSWGSNYYGQLGLGKTNLSIVYTPTLVPGINNVLDCILAVDNVFIMLENGTIMGVGYNMAGELGIDTPSSLILSFVEITSLNNIGTILFNLSTFQGDGSYFIVLQGSNSNQNQNSNSDLVVVIVPVILIFLLIITVLSILLIWYFKRKKSKLSPEMELSRETIKNNVTMNENKLIEGSKRIYKGNYTGKEVALKQILNNNLNEYNFYEKMDRNPNTLEYFGVYEYKGEKYIVLELLNSSLSQYLKFNSNLPVNKLVKFIKQTSICLSFLEEQGYIHGNICCDNILRKANDQLKLCDFQFTHKIYNPLTLSENDLSKIQFYGPEVKNNRIFSKNSDVWSLSVTCIQIFYLNQEGNEKPFQMNEENLNSKPSQCPDDLWNHIQKGLNFDPNLRPSFKEIEVECSKILETIFNSESENKSQNSDSQLSKNTYV